jgi:Peptidase propeptide and YPEB domain
MMHQPGRTLPRKENVAVNAPLRSSGRNFRAAVCLPSVVLTLGYLGATGSAVTALAVEPRPVTTFAATSLATDPVEANRWLHRVAEQDADDSADLPPGAKITREQASTTALKAVAGEVTSVDVERKLGRIVYTVEIMTSTGEETDVFVDVETGEVIGTE